MSLQVQRIRLAVLPLPLDFDYETLSNLCFLISFVAVAVVGRGNGEDTDLLPSLKGSRLAATRRLTLRVTIRLLM